MQLMSLSLKVNDIIFIMNAALMQLKYFLSLAVLKLLISQKSLE